MSERKNIVDGKAVAYIVAPSEDLKGWRVVLVREGDKGYRPLDDHPPGSSKERAEAIAGNMNRAIGVTKEEALLIAVGTMGGRRRAG